METGEALDPPQVAARLLAAAPAQGRVRVLAVDGPAGSGKTTAADRLGRELGAPVVHLDDLYEGWTGLRTSLWRRLREQVLEPLAAGRPASYRRYDWDTERFADWVPVPPTGLLVVEGVGAAARPVEPWLALRVWVESPPDVRLRRGIERDGEQLREQWLSWSTDEQVHFADDGTRDRADVLVDGTR